MTPPSAPRWVVTCPDCGDLYGFLMRDVAERLAAQHAYARTHQPTVELREPDDGEPARELA